MLFSAHHNVQSRPFPGWILSRGVRAGVRQFLRANGGRHDMQKAVKAVRKKNEKKYGIVSLFRE